MELTADEIQEQPETLGHDELDAPEVLSLQDQAKYLEDVTRGIGLIL